MKFEKEAGKEVPDVKLLNVRDGFTKQGLTNNSAGAASGSDQGASQERR